MDPTFRIETRSVDDVYIALLLGDLDVSCADLITKTLTETACPTLLVDLSGLTFMDASGLNALLTAKRRIAARGDRCELRSAHGMTRRVFAMCRVEQELAD